MFGKRRITMILWFYTLNWEKFEEKQVFGGYVNVNVEKQKNMAHFIPWRKVRLWIEALLLKKKKKETSWEGMKTIQEGIWAKGKFSKNEPENHFTQVKLKPD